MPISLWGGPLDGTISQDHSHLPLYLIATNQNDRPVYRRTVCECCASKRDSVPYVFICYEETFSPDTCSN
jgi:hypothetical protein